MNEKSRTSLENMDGTNLDVASSIMAVQIHQMLWGSPEYTLKLSELKSLILKQLSSNPKMMQQITKYPLSCTENQESNGMLHFPSKTSLDIYEVPKWQAMKVAATGLKPMENGLDFEHIVEHIDKHNIYQKLQREWLAKIRYNDSMHRESISDSC